MSTDHRNQRREWLRTLDEAAFQRECLAGHRVYRDERTTAAYHVLTVLWMVAIERAEQVVWLKAQETVQVERVAKLRADAEALAELRRRAGARA